MTPTDRLIQIASYQIEDDAVDLVERLAEHDIPSTLRNCYSSRLLGAFADVGGFIVEVPEAYRPQIRRLIAEGVIVLPDESDSTTGRLARWAMQLPLPARWGIQQRLTMLLVAILLIGAILSLVVLISLSL